MDPALFQELPNALLEGLLLGCVYAMIALGYTMVYGVLRLINFAHSEVFMIGAVAGVETYRYFAARIANPYLMLAVALFAGGCVSALTALAIERLAYRPLRGRSGTNRLVPLITAIGTSFFLQDFVRMIEGLWHNEAYMDFPSVPAFDHAIQLSNTTDLQVKAIIVMGVAVAMMAGLFLLVQCTRLGKAIRAVAQDMTTASLMGINPDRIISRTFLIGGFLGGVAGVLFGLLYTRVDPFIGFLPGVKAFTAAVLGGIGSIPGAMIGGVLLGITESLAEFYLPAFSQGAIGPEYKDVFCFLILVAFLLIRPQGLLGRPMKEKV